MNNDIMAQQLQREFERAKDFSQQGNMERTHQLVKLNRKTGMFARILPLGNIWFACRFDMAFIDVPGVKAVVTLSRSNEDNTQDDTDDELSMLLNRAISVNNQYRKLVNNNNAPDLINLNPNSKYNFSINHRVEFVGIPLVKTPQGGFAMAKSQTGNGYELVNYQVSLATYLELIQKLKENYLINQKPFETPLKFITSGDTYPVSIKMDSTGKHYSIDIRSDVPLQAVGNQYLEKDNEGNFIHFDNPYVFNQPTKEVAPGFYKRIVKAVKPLVEQGEHKLQEMQSQNSATGSMGSVDKMSQAPQEPNMFTQAPPTAQDEPKYTTPQYSQIAQSAPYNGNQNTKSQEQQPTNTQQNNQGTSNDPFADNAIPGLDNNVDFDFDQDFDF